MKEIKQISFPTILVTLSLLTLSGCSNFWVEKKGGVVSGCVDTSQGDRCDSDRPKDPQGVPPLQEVRAEGPSPQNE